MPNSNGSDALRLRNYIIYRCVIGSRAYGLEQEDSDTDRRGIYLPPADLQWSLDGVPEQLEDDTALECYWEIAKFLRLALKANPNVLECLYSPLVEHCAPVAAELIAMRESFLSRAVYQTYNAYAQSQFRKIAQDVRSRGTVRWKHVMHLIRLLISGIVVLREHFVPLRVDVHRDRLLAIRRGEMPWPEADAWRLRLHEEFDHALRSTTLPEHPDHARANQYLIRCRRLAADPGYVRP